MRPSGCSREREARRSGRRKAGELAAVAEAEEPAAVAAGAAELAVGAGAGRSISLERAVGEEGGEAVAASGRRRRGRRRGFRRRRRAGNQAWVKSGCSSKVGKNRARPARDTGGREGGCRSRPRKRAGRTRTESSRRDGSSPDRGFRPLAEPQMQHRLLVTPFVPAVVGRRSRWRRRGSCSDRAPQTCFRPEQTAIPYVVA